MTELKKSKEEVFKVLGYIIDCYEDYKQKNTSSFAKLKTFVNYSDFYEWLQGKVKR